MSRAGEGREVEAFRSSANLPQRNTCMLSSLRRREFPDPNEDKVMR